MSSPDAQVPMQYYSGAESNATSPNKATLYASSVHHQSKTSVVHHDNTLDQPPAVQTARVDGGAAAWLCLLGAFFGVFASLGQQFAFGTFQVFYSRSQLRSRALGEIAWIGSIQLGVFFLMGNLVGRLYDTRGPKFVLIPGTLLYIASLMIQSICEKFYQFILVESILMAIGAAMIFYPCMTAVGSHFVRYRATAMGVAIAGAGVGGIAFPYILNSLFASVGFGWAVRIVGFICLGTTLIACATVTSRLRPNRKGAWIDMASLRDGKFMLFSLGSGISIFGLFVPYFFISSYSLEQRMSLSMATTALSVMNAGGIVGRIIPPYVADKIGTFNVYIPLTTIAGVLCVAFWPNAHTQQAIMVFSFFYGLCSGAFLAINMPCIAQISRIEQIGTRIGMQYTIYFIPALFGGPIAGAILTDQRGDFQGMAVFSGVALIVGSVGVLVSRLMIDSRPFVKV